MLSFIVTNHVNQNDNNMSEDILRKIVVAIGKMFMLDVDELHHRESQRVLFV